MMAEKFCFLEGQNTCLDSSALALAVALKVNAVKWKGQRFTVLWLAAVILDDGLGNNIITSLH